MLLYIFNNGCKAKNVFVDYLLCFPILIFEYNNIRWVDYWSVPKFVETTYFLSNLKSGYQNLIHLHDTCLYRI